MKTVTKAANIVGLTVRMIQEYEKYGVAIKPTERNKYGYLMYLFPAFFDRGSWKV